jgi:hypothetical protein
MLQIVIKFTCTSLQKVVHVNLITICNFCNCEVTFCKLLKYDYPITVPIWHKLSQFFLTFKTSWQ